MSYVNWNYKFLASQFGILLAVVLLCISLASCNKPENTTAEKSVQKTFATPSEAGAAFLEAAKSGDQAALLAIFGPEGKDVLFSGDAVKDKNNLKDFVAAYGQMNRWVPIKAGGKMLIIGADNYPFPIPLRAESRRTMGLRHGRR